MASIELTEYNSTFRDQENDVVEVEVKPLLNKTHTIGFNQGSEVITSKVVGILGNGFYGEALAQRFRSCGVKPVIGTRRCSGNEIITKLGAETYSYEEACQKSDVIFLTIPRHAYDEVVPKLETVLRGKIIVDVSNKDRMTDSCNALYLSSLLHQSYIAKSLNTVSAWSLEYDLFGSTKNTYVCCDNQSAKQTIMDLMRDIGLTPVDHGRLTSANHIEDIPLRLFPDWKLAVIISVIVFIINSTIHFLRKGLLDHINTEEIASYQMNYLFGWQAITLFALVYMPGNIASFLQLVRGTKYSKFPNWLDRWMKARKQLGLIALLFVGMHACDSVLLMSGGYVFRMMRKIPINNNPGLTMYRRFTVEAEVSLLYAILSFATFTILGITSLPSVNARMSWREWDFVQSFMGYLGMCFGIMHIMVYAYNVFSPKYFKSYPHGIPPSVFLMPLLAMFVVLQKLILLMPCLRNRLIRIRSGRYNHPSKLSNFCC